MDQTERKPTRALPTVGFKLTVTSGQQKGATVVVEASRPGRLLVGKSPMCDLVLQDALVSRRHAAFEVTEDFRLCLTDLDSMNGTQANGVGIKIAMLEGGEDIQLGGVTLHVDVTPSQEGSSLEQTTFGRLIGESPRMRVLFKLCQRLASSDVPIVIEGETGTGKELLAECLHEASSRAPYPFVVFDATATSREMLDVVLFGEAGRKGLFEAAQGGTLLIDSIDELELPLQSKILRAIERGEIMPGGEMAWRGVDVRVMAATSKNLDRLVEAGTFREDLFFRLAVTRIEIPPLRRRLEDVSVLAAHFAITHRVPPQRVQDLLDRYAGYEWPGNVRELENTIARYAALGDFVSLLPQRQVARSVPEPHDTQEDFIRKIVNADLAYADARTRILDFFQRLYVERVLTQHGGNVSRAAAASGLARRYFQTLRSRHRP